MIEKELIKKHEGFRDSIYYDTLGVPTGGYGHAFLRGSKLPYEIWHSIFEHDYASAVNDYESLGLNLSNARRAVIVNMIFNIGLPKLKKFKKMLAALENEDYEAASQEMLNSRWAKQVGPGRSEELAEMMRTGLFPNEHR